MKHSQSEYCKADMLSSALGAGLESLLKDPAVIEIMLNPDGNVWAEYLGKGIEKTTLCISCASAERIIRLVASSNNKTCNYSMPSLSTVLPDCGSRFQGFMPPIVSSPCFTIRKKARQVFSLQQLSQQGVLSETQMCSLQYLIDDRKNILVVGGTGTGKTTFTNALLQHLAQSDDRIVVIEDTVELQCMAPNCLAFLAQPPLYTMQHAIKDVLRVRPDRIIVGEVRDGTALDLLKSWNTGHNGGVATLHANGSYEALTRLEQLIGEVTLSIPYYLIGEAVDIVVHIMRRNNQRSVASIVEVHGFKDGKYQLREIH